MSACQDHIAYKQTLTAVWQRGGVENRGRGSEGDDIPGEAEQCEDQEEFKKANEYT